MTNQMNETNHTRPGTLAPTAHGGWYEIGVQGQLDESWSDWLGGLEVKLLDNGDMLLSGYIGDQAALLGILNKLYGLNLALLSVSKVAN